MNLHPTTAPDIVCFGAAFLDELYTFRAPSVKETSNPARLKRAWGGVARNVAQHLAQLGLKVELVTQLGEDETGTELIRHCAETRIGLNYALKTAHPTGRFTAFLEPDGSLKLAATVTHLEEELHVDAMANLLGKLPDARIWMADTNLSRESLELLAREAVKRTIPLVLDPVSVPKSVKITTALAPYVHMICPNLEEARAISGSDAEPKELARHLLDIGFRSVWIRLGAEGSLFAASDGMLRVPAKAVKVLDSTGAGDAAMAAWLYGFLSGKNEATCVEWGHRLAVEVLQTEGANLPTLRPDFFDTLS